MKKLLKAKFLNIKNNKLGRSMLMSSLCKPVGMIISFLYTPVLLAYLGDEAYGIWSTILSVINWINYFDVGIGQGLRNTLSRYIALGDKKRAKKTVSTGYVVLTGISSVTFLIGTIIILIADVGAFFNTTLNIKNVIWVSFFCICINFILSLSRSQLYALQQAEKVGYMTVLTQAINLIGVLVLSAFSSQSLIGVAIVIGTSGLIVNLIFTGSLWRRHTYLIPNFRMFEKKELKGICNVGIKFFVIQIAALILYSTDNMIITQLFGPAQVTPYNTSYAAFGIVNGLFGAMIAPLWSKYTVAKEQNDYKWIKKTVINLDKTLPLIAIILAFGAIVFEPVSKIWLHKTIYYPTGLIWCMVAYYFLTVWGSIYATVMNGMSKINLQLILGIASAIANIPLSILLGKYCGLGTTGVCLATVICMFATNIPTTISIHRYLNKKILDNVK